MFSEKDSAFSKAYFIIKMVFLTAFHRVREDVVSVHLLGRGER